MNIAFFGTSDKSEPILNTLHNNFKLKLCVTKNDTKVGRKQEIRETSVKKWAKSNNILFHTIDSLNTQSVNEIINLFENEKIDLGIIADFNFIIPSTIYEVLSYGMINIHFSLLPKYRGASPVQHTILNHEEITGVTYMQIDEGMDTGDILYQVKYGLTGHETTAELYNNLFDIAAEHLPYVVNEYISGTLTPTKQDNKEATYCISPTHPKSTYIFKEDAEINWSFSLHDIYAQIRAYNPWPIAWTTLEDMSNANIMINNEGIINKTSKDAEAFKLVPKNEKDMRIKIHKAFFENEVLKILEIQPESKNIMSWNDFINGYLRVK